MLFLEILALSILALPISVVFWIFLLAVLFKVPE